MNEACEAILTEWRGGGLANCLAGKDVFLPCASPIGRVVKWTYPDEPDLIKTTMNSVDWATAKSIGIPVQQLHINRRGKEFARPRWLAMYLISEFCPNRSLPEIGRHFHRDHTTIIHGIRKAKALLAEDPDFAAAHTKARQILMGMQT